MEPTEVIVYDFSELVEIVTIQNQLLENVITALSTLIVGLFFILAFNASKSLIRGWFNGL